MTMRRLLFVALILCLWLAGWLRFYQLGAQRRRRMVIGNW